MAKAIKQKEWQDALEKVAHITDKLGMPVDNEIVETVAILYLLGFMTTSSCGGHKDRVNEGPFVILGSRKAMELEKQLATIANHNSQEYSQIKDDITYYNILEQSKLFHLMNQFYMSHRPAVECMLTIRSIGYSNFRLNCQGSELAYRENVEQKECRLVRNSDEIRLFTEWLKEYYFESSKIHELDLSETATAKNLFTGKTTEEYGAITFELAEVLKRYTGLRVSFLYDSCFDGANGGPYIVFESSKAEEIRKSVAATKHGMTYEERNTLYIQAMKYNTADQQRLYDLLYGFYTLRDIDYERALLIQTVGFSNFRLRHQNTEIVLVQNIETRNSKLVANCNEMRAFINYIKSTQK